MCSFQLQKSEKRKKIPVRTATYIRNIWWLKYVEGFRHARMWAWYVTLMPMRHRMSWPHLKMLNQCGLAWLNNDYLMCISESLYKDGHARIQRQAYKMLACRRALKMLHQLQPCILKMRLTKWVCVEKKKFCPTSLLYADRIITACVFLKIDTHADGW